VNALESLEPVATDRLAARSSGPQTGADVACARALCRPRSRRRFKFDSEGFWRRGSCGWQDIVRSRRTKITTQGRSRRGRVI